jgi:hypothetical protein
MTWDEIVAETVKVHTLLEEQRADNVMLMSRLGVLTSQRDQAVRERDEARRESHQYWEAMEGWKHGCGVIEAELQRYKDVVARAVNFASSCVGFCDDEGDNAREILSILATLKD